MTANHLRWPFLGLLVVFLVAANMASDASFGISSEWSSDSGYRFSGGTQPWALAFSVCAIILYFLLLYVDPAPLGQPLPTVFRRFVAFWLDFVFGMMAVGPLLGLLPMFVEWRRTGVFQWYFERATRAPGDWFLAFVGVSVAAVVLVLYYALPLFVGRPSPGTCIAGYQVVPDEGVRLTLKPVIFRTLFGFLAVAGAWFTRMSDNDRNQGKFWLDKKFNTRALKLG